LTSSAVVISGIGVLRDQWLSLNDPERTSIVNRIHRHAHAVDSTLRRFIAGWPA
jgi:hypothetical protein